MPTVKLSMESCTFGAEHELADWDCFVKGLPFGGGGWQRSPDYTIVNSNGIAAQPNVKVWAFGGEINTPATTTIAGQLKCLEQIVNSYNNVTINHRSNLHCHIRVPGLKDNLLLLKQIQIYIHEELPKVLDLIEPIPVGVTGPERKREKRRKISHHTLLTPHRLKKQLTAKTPKEFFELEVPATKSGKPMWHAQPRLCVGLRQLLQTDTVEFRHFPGTLSTNELETCFNWCYWFLYGALHGTPIEAIYEHYGKCQVFPKFSEFDEVLEVGYQATASHNGLKQEEIKRNISLILEGKFHATSYYQEARTKAGCDS